MFIALIVVIFILIVVIVALQLRNAMKKYNNFDFRHKTSEIIQFILIQRVTIFHTKQFEQSKKNQHHQNFTLQNGFNKIQVY